MKSEREIRTRIRDINGSIRNLKSEVGTIEIRSDMDPSERDLRYERIREIGIVIQELLYVADTLWWVLVNEKKKGGDSHRT